MDFNFRDSLIAIILMTHTHTQSPMKRRRDKRVCGFLYEKERVREKECDAGI